MPKTTTPGNGADLHLGGHAYAHPALKAHLTPIGDVTPYPGNPRRGDQHAIEASIRDLGLYRPIVSQRSTGHVLAGNHTLRALQALGATHVPVVTLDVTDTQAAALVIRDNYTAGLGHEDPADLLALIDTDPEVQLLAGLTDGYVADLRALLEPPDLDDLLDDFGDVTDTDHLVTIRAKVTEPTAALWRAARTQLGLTDDHAIDEALIRAACQRQEATVE